MRITYSGDTKNGYSVGWYLESGVQSVARDMEYDEGKTNHLFVRLTMGWKDEELDYSKAYVTVFSDEAPFVPLYALPVSTGIFGTDPDSVRLRKVQSLTLQAIREYHDRFEGGKKKYAVFFDDGVYGVYPVGYIIAKSYDEARQMVPIGRDEDGVGYTGLLSFDDAVAAYAPGSLIEGSCGLHDGGVHIGDWTQDCLNAKLGKE